MCFRQANRGSCPVKDVGRVTEGECPPWVDRLHERGSHGIWAVHSDHVLASRNKITDHCSAAVRVTNRCAYWNRLPSHGKGYCNLIWLFWYKATRAWVKFFSSFPIVSLSASRLPRRLPLRCTAHSKIRVSCSDTISKLKKILVLGSNQVYCN